MEYFREKYRAGVINTKAYENMIEILDYLQQKGYCFVEMLGEGTFGSVIKVKNLTSNKECAIKIVDENYVSEGEKKIWSTLEHKNILSLTSLEYVYFAKSCIFFTPVHPITLEKQIFDPILFTINLHFLTPLSF